MSERRFRHAMDDAPLYRVRAELGSGAWPAYREYDGKVVLDIAGDLVTFLEHQLVLIARPQGLPDWAVAIALEVIARSGAYHHADKPCCTDSKCWDRFVQAIPDEAREWLDTQRTGSSR